ncbi:hypothetical protein [Paraburkholderia youngii]|uniref:hypothetical protein n=1 Tax=Paraburkholderia youngii TaxID=2782701 RepID=UPI003D1A90F7
MNSITVGPAGLKFSAAQGKELKHKRNVSPVSRDHDAIIVERAASLPADRRGLLDEALQAVRALDAAVLASDVDAANAAADSYDAAVFKLNGDTFFGCNQPSNPEAGGILAENHCKAAPGVAPMWGQCGEFLITASGIPAVVGVADGFGRFRACFGFHVVNPHGPFISETGYISHFAVYRQGQTVQEVAAAVFSELLATDGIKVLRPDARERKASDPSWSWMDAPQLPCAQDFTYKETGGQFAFSF